MLGEAGATVYCTGRSSRKGEVNAKRPETIEETAEMVDAYGGVGIPLRVDHSDASAVNELIATIEKEQGRLNILINDIWGGDALTEWGKSYWELNLDQGFALLKQAIHTHLITSRAATPLMLEQSGGMIVEITDGNTYEYRGNLFYDMIKTGLIRVAFAMAWELRKKDLSVVAVTPGFLRSEAMLEHFGVTEENWKEGVKADADFIASETPFFVGRAIAALAADPQLAEKSGRVFSSWDLSDMYGFTDIDGNRPHWGKHVQEKYQYRLKRCDDEFYGYWQDGLIDRLLAE